MTVFSFGLIPQASRDAVSVPKAVGFHQRAFPADTPAFLTIIPEVSPAPDAPRDEPEHTRMAPLILIGQNPQDHLAALKKHRDTGETGRIRKFTRQWIAEGDDALDISWLNDDNAESMLNSASLI